MSWFLGWLGDSPLATATWVDALDVGLLAWLVYRVLLLIQGTRAMQSLIGLGLLGVVYLASDLSREVTGQIFAVRKDEIFLMSQPRPLRVAHKDGGWTPRTIADAMLPAFRSGFYPLDRSQDVFSWEPL